MTMPRFRGALLLSRCADLRALPAHDAAEPQRLLGDGLRVGNVLLRPLMLALGQLAQAIIDVLFLTAGLAEQATPVAIASRTRHLPCIISDLSQLHAATIVTTLRRSSGAIGACQNARRLTADDTRHAGAIGTEPAA